MLDRVAQPLKFSARNFIFHTQIDPRPSDLLIRPKFRIEISCVLIIEPNAFKKTKKHVMHALKNMYK